jgi:hypothetical protein
VKNVFWEHSKFWSRCATIVWLLIFVEATLNKDLMMIPASVVFLFLLYRSIENERKK